MKWQVQYYKTVDNKEPVKDWLDTFDKQTKVKIRKYFERLERKRLNLKHPFIRHLETQLYEINILEGKRVFKIIFFPNYNRKLVLLHGFSKNISRKKKTQTLITSSFKV